MCTIIYDLNCIQWCHKISEATRHMGDTMTFRDPGCWRQFWGGAMASLQIVFKRSITTDVCSWDKMWYSVFTQSHNLKIFKRLPLEAEARVRNEVFVVWEMTSKLMTSWSCMFIENPQAI